MESIMTSDFTHVTLPRLGTRVLRIGVAGNYGLRSEDIPHAADRGVRYWVWTPNFRKVTPGLREVLANRREEHVVAMLGVAYTAGMVRRGVEKALRALAIDRLDVYQLSWLGTGSLYGDGIREMLARLRDEGKIGIAGCSIHDRQRAGTLAEDSSLDLFMLRYNAAHPGAEQDVFPHLAARAPAVVAYTATSWRQLLKPMGIAMPPWPGPAGEAPVPPPLTPALCYRFCLTSPHVHVVLTGPANRAQLDENLQALEAGPLPPEQDAWIREYGRHVRARKRIPFV